MDEKTLQKAVDDISTIKEIIDRTGRSFTSFSKIFIYWGFLFILNGVLNLFITANKELAFEIYQKYPMLSYLLPLPVISLIAAVIYFSVAKKLPLVGLEKHLLKVWLLILVLNVLPRKLQIVSMPGGTSISSIAVLADNLNMLYFSLAIALIVTSLFTGFKQPMYVGFLFIAISIISSYIRIPADSNTLYQLLHAIALPFTFLYTGLYLRSKKLGGIPIGNQLNS